MRSVKDDVAGVGMGETNHAHLELCAFTMSMITSDIGPVSELDGKGSMPELPRVFSPGSIPSGVIPQ